MMSIEKRRAAIFTVETDFMNAEKTAEDAAHAAAACIKTMIEQRRHTRLAPIDGVDALELVAEGVLHATRAHVSMSKAHPILAGLRAKIDPVNYGPSDECVPNSPFTGATHPKPLRVVG